MQITRNRCILRILPCPLKEKLFYAVTSLLQTIASVAEDNLLRQRKYGTILKQC